MYIYIYEKWIDMPGSDYGWDSVLSRVIRSIYISFNLSIYSNSRQKYQKLFDPKPGEPIIHTDIYLDRPIYDNIYWFSSFYEQE